MFSMTWDFAPSFTFALYPPREISPNKMSAYSIHIILLKSFISSQTTTTMSSPLNIHDDLPETTEDATANGTTGTKRKRTGKQRQLAKEAAIAAAAALAAQPSEPEDLQGKDEGDDEAMDGGVRKRRKLEDGNEEAEGQTKEEDVDKDQPDMELIKQRIVSASSPPTHHKRPSNNESYHLASATSIKIIAYHLEERQSDRNTEID